MEQNRLTLSRLSLHVVKTSRTDPVARDLAQQQLAEMHQTQLQGQLSREVLRAPIAFLVASKQKLASTILMLTGDCTRKAGTMARAETTTKMIRILGISEKPGRMTSLS